MGSTTDSARAGGQRRPGRPRRRVLSRDAIADAALDIGFEHLTLVAVAERLGVTHASLYGHISDRDDLVIAAADRLIERAPWPEPSDDWRDYLAEQAWVLWGVAAENPGVSRAVQATGRAPKAMAAHFATMCRHLVTLGFSPEHALLAGDTVFDLAADSSDQTVELRNRSDEERRALAEDWSIPLDEPGLASTMFEAFTGEPSVWFGRKLDLVLAGIEARLAP